jgi:hypothetical protein
MFSPKWLKKKKEQPSVKQAPVKPNIKILPPTPQYQKEFRPESPSPSPPPNRLRASFTSSILPPPHRPTPKPLTEAEKRNIDKVEEQARRWFALLYTPSPSKLSPTTPNLDIVKSSDDSHKLDEIQLEETATVRLSGSNGGKMSRNMSRKKSKSKKHRKSKRINR